MDADSDPQLLPAVARLYHRESLSRAAPLAMYHLTDPRVSIDQALSTLRRCLPFKWQIPLAVIDGGKA